MANTLTPEKWGRKESADWWSAGQAARQAQANPRSWQLAGSAQWDTCLPQMFPPAC